MVTKDTIAMTRVICNHSQPATSGIEVQFWITLPVMIVVVETNQVSGLLLLTRSLVDLMNIPASHVRSGGRCVVNEHEVVRSRFH